MVRPIVLVFQEFAEQVVTPTTPDLNCLIIGPAYQIQDYPDDALSIEVSAYGEETADNPYSPPIANVPAITLAAPPGITAGAWVDPDSIRVYFDEANVILADGTDGVTVNNDNKLTSASATFVTDGVAAGDILIVDNPVGPPTPNLILRVISVDSETVLRVSTNFTASLGSLDYRVERTLNDQLVDDVFVNPPVFRVSNQIDILGGVTLTVGAAPRVVSYARVFVAYRAFRTDLQSLDTVQNTSEILTKVGRVDARNPLAVALSVAKQNAGQAPVQFYGVRSQDVTGYTLARDAVSTDDTVYAVVPLITSLPVISAFKTDNEQLADPNQALTDGVPQKFRVVIGSSALTATETVAAEVTDGTYEAKTGATPPGIKTITIASLTALSTNLRPGDKLVLSASENVAPLDGTYTIAHINSNTEIEVDEAFPVAVAAAEGINYTITRPSTGATIVALVDNRASTTLADVLYTSLVAGVTPGARTIALVQDATTPNGIHSIVEVAGVSTIINGDFASTNITASEVVAALNLGVGVTVTFTGSINLVASTTVPATVQTAQSATAVSTDTPGVDDLTSTDTLDDAYIVLFDSNAEFFSDGVVAGDIVEIPNNPNGVFATNTKQYIVNTVLSEQRLEIVNISAGVYQNNTSTVEYELPHLDNRLGTGTLVTNGSIRYRILRELSRDQQITQLVSESQSLNSRRAILTWPDVVRVAGLVDGSKPRNSDGSLAAADPQPGYYLSAVVGGMTAGLPSHQGFSRLGIAGIDSIDNSSDYFTERQLTQLSDGGWYVFAQNTPTSLPYSIHQLTTDPSTLQSGEYSIVKNFDFVSLYFLDILEPFLGVWNVNDDTIGFIRQALNTGIESLKLRRVAKIGAPINSASIASVAVSTASSDRVEIFMNVSLPVPLNVLGLHLVA